MSRIGIGSNLHQPNKQCLSCKYWKSAKRNALFGWTEIEGGKCTAGYCKKNEIKKRK